MEACPGGPRTGFAWAWLFGSYTGDIENGVRPRPGEDPSLVVQPWYDPGGQGDWTLLWPESYPTVDANMTGYRRQGHTIPAARRNGYRCVRRQPSAEA